MAYRPERAKEALPGDFGPIGDLYQELSQFPSVVYASVGVGFAAFGGAECLPLYTEWCQPDLGRHQKLQFSRQYILHHDGTAVVPVTPVGVPVEIRDQLLIRMSPTGMRKAVLTHHLEMGQKQEVLEVWSNSGRVRSINLTALDKHGRVYTDGQFGCFAWSSSETQILYVAERRHPKRQPLFSQDSPPQEGEKPVEARKDEQFLYYDNWGEALSDKSFPVLCVLNIETSKVSVLEGIPEHISPGQALWSPDDKGIVFVGWWHEPFRLGLNACSNRRSALFLLDPSGSSCELLSSDSQAISSPRLSPDRTHLVYLEGPVFGPHRQCLKLQMLSWQTKLTSTVVDIVRTATTGFFGIYSGALPLHCWAGDNHRVLLSTPQRSRKELLVVDTKLGSVKCITAGTPEGSWTLLGIQQDLLVMSCSSPNCPPSLVVGVLPPAGSELELQWTSVEKASVLPDTEWKTLTVHPTVTVEGNHDAGQAFEALLLSPQESKRGENIFPLVVSPHGGPHAVFDACWCPKMACLCQLGFAVLMVNYRGSLGFGQASIESLISHVGVQDVEDTQLAVELALQMEPLDPDRIALLGGSHGGFVCCHLIGRYPEMYKACAVRSPVINMATLLGTSDIPDWRYAVLGLPYCFERIPTKEDLAAMLLCSPIIHAAKVRTPLLICVGAKDRRVSPYQAMEYYRVLRAREIPVKLLWYPEENHAISGVEAGAAVFLNCAQWMIHHLSKESADAESQQAAKTSEV
ncbi:acylamino-acid-releasing enzyme-like isoform X2 [Rhineura floridana]|uniref:acylamino-acid-releasing enzyme-like isoform X2 n=1 Tax=Rhineura floridana TaxID=261503 RepID=UPI002AC8312A|nr:acylamino-acid-releasing enzyme-like isoform X2 [Rhineura floridana]